MPDPFPIFDAHLHFSQAYLDRILRSFELFGVEGDRLFPNE